MDGESRLLDIARSVRRCRNCEFQKTRRRAVPGEGPRDARVLLVGEAPGRTEDETGRPFIGRSGQLLTEVLEEAGFSRDGVFITSVVKCRPPGNKKPLKRHIESCLPHLKAQAEALSPRVICLLGGTATSALLGISRVKDARGQLHDWQGTGVWVTYHPAAVLRGSVSREEMVNDLKRLRAFTASATNGRPPP